MNKEIKDIEQIKAKKDLKIIFLSLLIPVILYVIFEGSIMDFVKTSSLNVWIKCLPIILIQFGMSGLGILIVIFYRKEKLKEYGLIRKNFFKTLLFSFLVCIPHFVYLLLNGKVNSYFPLQGSIVTRIFIASEFPTNILGYILCVIIWGFLEGLFYPAVSKKINTIHPYKNKLLNYGAMVCGIICILIHGMIGFDLNTIFEAATTFILVYGMLIIKEETGNAWGCILISVLFWNAFR